VRSDPPMDKDLGVRSGDDPLDVLDGGALVRGNFLVIEFVHDAHELAALMYVWELVPSSVQRAAEMFLRQSIALGLHPPLVFVEGGVHPIVKTYGNPTSPLRYEG